MLHRRSKDHQTASEAEVLTFTEADLGESGGWLCIGHCRLVVDSPAGCDPEVCTHAAE